MQLKFEKWCSGHPFLRQASGGRIYSPNKEQQAHKPLRMAVHAARTGSRGGAESATRGGATPACGFFHAEDIWGPADS